MSLSLILLQLKFVNINHFCITDRYLYILYLPQNRSSIYVKNITFTSKLLWFLSTSARLQINFIQKFSNLKELSSDFQ